MSAKIWAALALCGGVVSLRADLVVLQNGDRYHGKVLSVTTNLLVLQSDVLGRVSLARATIAHVSFGTNAAAEASTAAGPSSPPAPPATITRSNAAGDVPASLRQLAAHTNLIQKVQSQFLATASPEASAKFAEMLNDLTTGKMTMADLRAQARDVADQLRALQRESGQDGGFTADLYLSILDKFVAETAPDKPSATNAAPVPRPKP
jgi:hypothetical protein